MNRCAAGLATGFLFVFPLAAEAGVYVSEVAWMGTDAGYQHEWIELGNDGPDAVPIAGWTLSTEDGTPKPLTLSGSVPAGGYFVIAKSASSVATTVGQVWTGISLNNDGEKLLLKDAAGNIVDVADGSGDWPGGKNETGEPRETMQRTRSMGWTTALPTPGEENAEEAEDAEPEPTVSSTTPSGTPSSHSSGAFVATREVTKMSLGKGRDRLIMAGSEARFDAVARDSKGEEVPGAKYEWSFGDGAHEHGSTVRHAYAYPGTYVVVVNAEKGRAEAVSRFTVRVVESHVRISSIAPEYVELENASAYEANLQGWKLDSERGDFIFPKDTIILPKAKVRFPRSVAGIKGSAVRLVMPSGEDTAEPAALTPVPAASSSPAAALGAAAKPAPLPQATVSAATKPAPTPKRAAAAKPAPKPVSESKLVQEPERTGSEQAAAVVNVYRAEPPRSLIQTVRGLFRDIWR